MLTYSSICLAVFLLVKAATSPVLAEDVDRRLKQDEITDQAHILSNLIDQEYLRRSKEHRLLPGQNSINDDVLIHIRPGMMTSDVVDILSAAGFKVNFLSPRADSEKFAPGTIAEDRFSIFARKELRRDRIGNVVASIAIIPSGSNLKDSSIAKVSASIIFSSL